MPRLLMMTKLKAIKNPDAILGLMKCKLSHTLMKQSLLAFDKKS
jgi:hypothetical protein